MEAQIFHCWPNTSMCITYQIMERSKRPTHNSKDILIGEIMKELNYLIEFNDSLQLKHL